MKEEIYGAAFRGSERQKTKPGAFGNGGEGWEPGLDLNEELIRNPSATYFFRMKGDAMQEAGISDGDILIVDRSIRLTEGRIIVAILNGELLVRRFHRNFSSAFLIPENNRYKPINLAEFTDFTVWGVVIHSIHTFN